MTPSTGFAPPLFDFLVDLRANNDREWFNAHKTRYKRDVVGPLQEFIIAMEPRLEMISPHYIANPKSNGGSMFRIYRDVRFSKDKRPYKEHAACQFRHEMARDVHAPGFYVHLEPGQVFFGGGVWRPDGPALGKIRERIRDRADEWQSVRDELAGAGLEEIRGEALKRPPRGYAAEEPHIDDIKHKSFFVMREAPQEIALSGDFADQVSATFAAAAPLMRFVCKSIDAPF